MSRNGSGLAPAQLRWRESRLLIVIELLLIVAAFVADDHHLLRFGKTPYLLALGWGSMAVRGVRWSDVGLSLDPQWRLPALVGVLAGIVLELVALFVTHPLMARLTGQVPDVSDFHDLSGNLTLLFSLVAGGWVAVALAEELFWRGYLLNRLTDLYGRNRGGWMIAVLFTGVAFGLAYSDQGSIRVIEKLFDGLALGGLYLACNRRLIAPILAHGVAITLNYLLIYSGHYPGM